MTKREVCWTIARWIFGLFFLGTGMMIWTHVLTGFGAAPVQPTARAQAFTDALTATGFMDPLVGLSYIAGGGALLAKRTSPLGLVLLGPSIVVILFFHLTLSGQIVWGPFVAAWFSALTWRFREPLFRLVGYSSKIERASRVPADAEERAAQTN
jgi:hypothetical protein